MLFSAFSANVDYNQGADRQSNQPKPERFRLVRTSAITALPDLTWLAVEKFDVSRDASGPIACTVICTGLDDQSNRRAFNEGLFEVRCDDLIHPYSGRFCIPLCQAKWREILLALWEVIFGFS